MRCLNVLMTLVFVLTAPAFAGTEPRIALVIGNGNYENTASLSNPVNDARLIAGTLRSLGFEVIEHVDLKQKEMKRAIRDFGEELERGGEAAVGLFYYAGHGVQVGGRNYVVPVDADITRQGDVDIEALAADAILSTIAFANNGINFVILDACRNNPYARSFRSQARGLARMDAPRGSLVAYATAPGDVAADGKGDNSPYTQALVEAMEQTGLSAEHVFRRTRQLVMASTNDQQVPWEASSLTGDFFFSAAEAEAPAPAPEMKGPSEEMVFWQSIQSGDDPAAFRGYLEQYPEGTFAVLARANLNFLERQKKAKDDELKRQEEELKRQEEAARHLAELEAERLRIESERLQLVSKKAEMAAANSEAPSAEVMLWQSIKDSSDPANYQDYLSQFPDGAFAEVAKRRKERYAAQRLAALRQHPVARAPSRVALTLPPPPTERVKFGTATLVVTWANGRRRNGEKETIWPNYDVFTTDTLQTVSNGALHVAFDDGAMLRIGASTDAIVESFGPDQHPDNPGVALALTKGVLRFSAGVSGRAIATVRTPAAVMRLNSSDFMVEVASDKSTRVLVIAGEGNLASTLGGAAVLLSPGTTVTMTKESPDAILDRLASRSTDAEEVAVFFSQDLGITEKGQNIEEFAGGDGSGDGDGGDGGGDH